MDRGLRLAGKYGDKSILTCLLLLRSDWGARWSISPLFSSLSFFMEAAGTGDWVLGMVTICSTLLFACSTLYLSIRLSLIFPVMTRKGSLISNV